MLFMEILFFIVAYGQEFVNKDFFGIPDMAKIV